MVCDLGEIASHETKNSQTCDYSDQTIYKLGLLHSRVFDKTRTMPICCECWLKVLYHAAISQPPLQNVYTTKYFRSVIQKLLSAG